VHHDDSQRDEADLVGLVGRTIERVVTALKSGDASTLGGLAADAAALQRRRSVCARLASSRAASSSRRHDLIDQVHVPTEIRLVARSAGGPTGVEVMPGDQENGLCLLRQRGHRLVRLSSPQGVDELVSQPHSVQPGGQRDPSDRPRLRYLVVDSLDRFWLGVRIPELHSDLEDQRALDPDVRLDALVVGSQDEHRMSAVDIPASAFERTRELRQWHRPGRRRRDRARDGAEPAAS
jgi:hypothetical protein